MKKHIKLPKSTYLTNKKVRRKAHQTDNLAKLRKGGSSTQTNCAIAALASHFAVYASPTAQMRLRAIARNTSCYVCLLCPLRTISANATRLRLSLLVVVPRKFCRKAKDFAKGKSVPNDTDFLGGEGWIRTTEVTDNRFTVCSLWPLGNLSVWSW